MMLEEVKEDKIAVTVGKRRVSREELKVSD